MADILLYDLFNEYLNSISKSSSECIKYYIKDFKNFFIQNKHISCITVNDIQKYINYKRSFNLKDTTLYRYYRMIKTIFNYAISHEYLEKNPCIRR